MAATRSKRSVKDINYALYSTIGKKTSSASLSSVDSLTEKMAEHELAGDTPNESPFRIHNEDDDFHTDSNLAQETDRELLDETLTHDSHSELGKQEEESLLSVNEQDLISDEVWQQQQSKLRQNKEKRERLKVQLERRKLLNEALLREEEERRTLARMEQECSRLEQKRLGTNSVTFARQLQYGRRPNPGDNDVTLQPEARKSALKNVNKPSAVSELAQFDNRDGLPSQYFHHRPVDDRISQWLADSEDLSMFHETRSEPGQRNSLPKKINIKVSNSRKALRDERKTSLGEGEKQMAKATRAHPTGTGARPKLTQKEMRQTPRRTDKYSERYQEGELALSDHSDAWTDNCSEVSQLSDCNLREKLRSGFLDKPRSQVLVKLLWPHMNQNPRYVTSSLTFNQLNFAQFVGGECRTILKTETEHKLIGRLKILSKIAYLYDQCRDWEKARSAYFAILSSIEEGESTWWSSFGHYDMMCPPRVEEQHSRADLRQPPRVKPTPKKDFYCREFQKGECSLTTPHKSWIKNSYETVDHFCGICYRAKAGKQVNSPIGGGTVHLKNDKITVLLNVNKF